jgi:hypothetical protein
MLPRDWLVDEVWIGNRIHWTLQHTTRDYMSLSHRLMFPVAVFTVLVGTVPKQWTFLSHPRRLAAISHQPPPLATAVSGLCCNQSRGQSQSHIATDGLSVCLSWCRAPAGAHDQMFLLV